MRGVLLLRLIQLQVSLEYMDQILNEAGVSPQPHITYGKRKSEYEGPPKHETLFYGVLNVCWVHREDKSTPHWPPLSAESWKHGSLFPGGAKGRMRAAALLYKEPRACMSRPSVEAQIYCI